MSKHFTSAMNEKLLASLLAETHVRNEGARSKGYFSTVSGHDAFMLYPEESYIDIHDIGVALGRIPRWGGRTSVYDMRYSVAEHSVMVSKLCNPEHALIGLLHDAVEAYLGDVISPLKRCIQEAYLPIEMSWAKEIGKRFGLGDKIAFLPVDVQCADLIALQVENYDLMKPRRLGAVWGPDKRPTTLPEIKPVDEFDAYALFMNRYAELTQ